MKTADRALSFAAALAALVAAGCRTAEPRPPNILVVLADDHASHAISAYGSRIASTPNIDRLAAEGVRFTRYGVGNAICAPSRATILTGLHSHRHGVIDNAAVFDGRQATFPKLLRDAGYETALVGKWHLKSDPTGFDHFEILIDQGPYYNPPMKTAGGRLREHEGYTTDVITDLALDWLERGRDRAKPFLLLYQHKAPHREWQSGPDHLSLFDGVEIAEPATLFDDWRGRSSAASRQEMTIARHLTPLDLKLTPPRNLTPGQLAAWTAAYGPENAAFERARPEGDDLVRWKYQRYIKDYLRAVASIDDNLGRVLDYLDESGLAGDTVVVYTSDQGFFLGDHGWYDKRWMYEPSFLAPLVVRWPGVARPGAVESRLAQNVDLAPTFLDMAGVAVPPGAMDGRSLVPLLSGEKPGADWRRSLYYHYYEFPGVHSVERHRGVRTDAMKLVHYYRIGEWELFDLEKDPDEMRSVHADPAYAEALRGMRSELERLRELYGDTGEEEERGAPGTPRLDAPDRRP